MIVFSCPDAAGKIQPEQNPKGAEVYLYYVPNISDVMMNEIEGHTILKMLGLPKLPHYVLEVDQLPMLKQSIQRLLGFDSELEEISNNSFDRAAQSSASYIIRILKELFALVSAAMEKNYRIQWLRN